MAILTSGSWRFESHNGGMLLAAMPLLFTPCHLFTKIHVHSIHFTRRANAPIVEDPELLLCHTTETRPSNICFAHAGPSLMIGDLQSAK